MMPTPGQHQGADKCDFTYDMQYCFFHHSEDDAQGDF